MFGKFSAVVCMLAVIPRRVPTSHAQAMRTVDNEELPGLQQTKDTVPDRYGWRDETERLWLALRFGTTSDRYYIHPCAVAKWAELRGPTSAAGFTWPQPHQVVSVSG
jgi:hypothetical protein